jgi:Na+:H+ antiporter, NhaA family
MMAHTAEKLPPNIPLPARPIEAIARPIRRFLEIESASGVFLAVCTVIALVLANSSVAHSVHDFWETHAVVGVGPFRLDESLHFWVNDALMTLFFFIVGLEIKRELVAGELSSWRKAALPAAAALGGMVVPAGVYLMLNPGGPASRGWGVPMATDIAFVVGVLAVFGNRVPFGLKIFLLALAIVDDIGAILVIAVAYTGSPDWNALGAAAGGMTACYVLNQLGVRAVAVYVLIGVGVWLATFRSGVHPTIAGVLLGLLTPSAAWVGRATLRDVLDAANRVAEDRPGRADLGKLAFAVRESVSPLERLEYALHPWVGFIIMPVFALANAGVAVQLGQVTDPTAVAVAVGLVAGKPLGIVLFSYLAVKMRLAQLPTGVTWRLLTAAGCLGGIGFTMSLFVAQLAFPDGPLLDAGKVGILTGSLASGVIGSTLLVLGLKKDLATDEHR